MCLKLQPKSVLQCLRGDSSQRWELLTTPPKQQQQHWNAKWRWRVQSTSSMATSTTTFFLQNKSIFRSYTMPRQVGWKSKPLPTLHRLPSACIEGGSGSPWHPQYCPSLSICTVFHMLHLYTHRREGFDWDNILFVPQIPQGINSIGYITFAYMAGSESLQLS